MQYTLLEQTIRVFTLSAGPAKSLLAIALGTLFGGIAPIAAYQLSHYEIQNWSDRTILTLPGWVIPAPIIVACLVVSSKTVFQWLSVAFGGDLLKAGAFTILLEGIMAASQTPWLSRTCLGLLVLANVIATTNNLISQKRPLGCRSRQVQSPAVKTTTSKRKVAPMPMRAVV